MRHQPAIVRQAHAHGRDKLLFAGLGVWALLKARREGDVEYLAVPVDGEGHGLVVLGIGDRQLQLAGGQDLDPVDCRHQITGTHPGGQSLAIGSH